MLITLTNYCDQITISMPGGKRSIGESPYQCCLRELAEEVRFGQLTNNNNNNNEALNVFNTNNNSYYNDLERMINKKKYLLIDDDKEKQNCNIIQQSEDNNNLIKVKDWLKKPELFLFVIIKKHLLVDVQSTMLNRLNCIVEIFKPIVLFKKIEI